MCAIFGYKCFDVHRPTVEDIADLANVCESRGKDASGMAWFTGDGRLAVSKAPIEASVYLKRENVRALFAKTGVPELLIGHARAATQGSPWNDVNNHPIVDRQSGTAIVHNGIVSNDDEVYKGIKVTRKGQVDSEAILGVLMHAQGGLQNRISEVGRRIQGSYACALLSTQLPGTLALFRHASPCALWWDAVKRIIWFASTKDIVDIVRSEEPAGPLPWLPPPVEMPNDHYIIFRGDGQTDNGSFKAQDGIKVTRTFYKTPPVHSAYDQRSLPLPRQPDPLPTRDSDTRMPWHQG